MKDTEILSKVPLFSLMKNRDLQRIVKLSKHHSFQPGDIIVREGERDGRLFIIIAGKVEVIKDLGTPQEKTLRVFFCPSTPGKVSGRILYDKGDQGPFKKTNLRT